MPTYNPPLRDMQFVLHEVFNVTEDFRQMPAFAEVDADTINAVLEEGGKFASQVIQPLNISGDTEGCTLEAHAFSEAAPEFRKLGATVIGMSADDDATLRRFSTEACRRR